MDRSIAHASPVNAIVVLSRADEIGAARPDALDSARSIAARYAANPRVRELASGVVPVAGLHRRDRGDAAPGAVRLAARRRPAGRDRPRPTSCARSTGSATPTATRSARRSARSCSTASGLYGLRLAVAADRRGRRSRRATELSGALLEHSGIRELQRVLAEQYTARAQALKARSALAALRVDRRGARPARRPGGGGPGPVGRPARGLVPGPRAPPPAAPRAVRARSRWPPTSEPRSTGCAARARAASGSAWRPTRRRPDLQAAAIAGIERWRSRAGNPMSDRQTVEAAEIVSRAYEEIYAGAT